jgi:hypothetical protein
MVCNKKNNFVNLGYASFASFFDPIASKNLLRSVLESRSFDNLFLSEDDFLSAISMTGVNPRPGRNLAEKLDTDFIFGNKNFANLMREILGNKFRVMDYKFVSGVPTSKLPHWLSEKIKDKLVNNLGAYIKPKFRDITYFHGIDYHQDIIDYPHRSSDFITVYVYLDQVTLKHAPLHVLSGSHLHGCSTFPHNLSISNNIVYTNSCGKVIECDDVVLTGEAGDMSLWHSSTLHGTQPQSNDSNRVSLRILVERNQSCSDGCWLDEANKLIDGPLQLDFIREDLDPAGRPKLSGNKINRLLSK